jgi:hypothetical protein
MIKFGVNRYCCIPQVQHVCSKKKNQENTPSNVEVAKLIASLNPFVFTSSIIELTVCRPVNMSKLSNGWLRLPNEIFDYIVACIDHRTITQLAATSQHLRLRLVNNKPLWKHACMLYYSAGEMERLWFNAKVRQSLTYCNGSLSSDNHVNDKVTAYNSTADGGKNDNELEHNGCSWYQLWCWCRRMEQRWRSNEVHEHIIKLNSLTWPLSTESSSAKHGLLYNLLATVTSGIENRLYTRTNNKGNTDQITVWATCFSGTLLERTSRGTALESSNDPEHTLFIAQPDWTNLSTGGKHRASHRNERKYQFTPLETPKYFSIISVKMDALNIVVHVRTGMEESTKIYIWQSGRTDPICWNTLYNILDKSLYGAKQEWKPLSLFNGWLMLITTATATGSESLAPSRALPGNVAKHVFPIHACYLPTLSYFSLEMLKKQLAFFSLPGINLMMRADHKEMTFIHLEHDLENPRHYHWSLHKVSNANHQLPHSINNYTPMENVLVTNQGGGVFFVDSDISCTTIAANGVEAIRINDYQVVIEIKTLGLEKRWLGMIDTRNAKPWTHASLSVAPNNCYQLLAWSLTGDWNRLPFLMPGNTNTKRNEQLLLTFGGRNPNAESLYYARCIDIATGTVLRSIERTWRLEVLSSAYVRIGHLIPVTDLNEACKYLDTSTSTWKLISLCNRASQSFSERASLFYTVTHRLTNMAFKSTSWSDSETEGDSSKYHILDATTI